MNLERIFRKDISPVFPTHVLHPLRLVYQWLQQKAATRYALSLRIRSRLSAVADTDRAPATAF